MTKGMIHPTSCATRNDLQLDGNVVTALMSAASIGHLDIAKYLAGEKAASVDAANSHSRTTYRYWRADSETATGLYGSAHLCGAREKRWDAC